MRNVMQVTAKTALSEETWFDVMDVPETVNDLDGFLKVAKQDFGERKVRIVQIVAE